MRPAVLVVIFDFLFASLLFAVTGTPSDTSERVAADAELSASEFSAASVAAMEAEWESRYARQEQAQALQDAQQAKRQLGEEVDQLEAKAAAQQADLSEARSALADTRARAQAQAADLARLETELQAVDAENQRLSETHQAFKARIAGLTQELEQAREAASPEKQAADEPVPAAELEAALVEAEQTALAMDRALASRGTTLERLKEDLGTRVEALQAMQEADAVDPATAAELQSRIEAEAKRLAQTEAEAEALRAERDRFLAERDALAREVERLNVRRRGPYRPMRQARMEVTIRLARDKVWPLPHARFTETLYAPVIRVDGDPRIVAAWSDLGLAWSGLQGGLLAGDLVQADYTVAKRGDNPWSRGYEGTLAALETDPRAVQLTLEALPEGVEPVPVIGREALELRGLSDVYLLKRRTGGLLFEVNASFNMADRRYLEIPGLAPDGSATRAAADVRPTRGDFVVTAEGELIGVLVTDRRCLILSAADLQRHRTIIPVGDRAAFAEKARTLSGLEANP